MKIILSLLIVFFITATASAEIAVNSYKELKKKAETNEDAKVLLNSYLLGVGLGIR